MSTVDLDFYCDFNSDQLFDRLQKNNRVSTYKGFFFFFFQQSLTTMKYNLESSDWKH